MTDHTDRMYAQARETWADWLARELDRELAWAQHVAQAMDLVAPREEP